MNEGDSRFEERLVRVNRGVKGVQEEMAVFEVPQEVCQRVQGCHAAGHLIDFPDHEIGQALET
jgi:hypothetical protein